MKCILPVNSVKVFAKAVHCLAKIGNEIHFEALENGLALKTVDMSRSAFVCFTFMRPMFEAYYVASDHDDVGNDDDDANFMAKVAVKTLLQVFRSANSIEKTVKNCHINADDATCRLVFELNCRYGMKRTHHLTYQECDTLQANVDKSACPNALKCDTKVMSDAAANFPTNLEEISMSVSSEGVKLSNFTSDIEQYDLMKTDMKLNPGEFHDFQIGVDTEISFCFKHLRAVISFCEAVDVPLDCHFDGVGKPLVVSAEQENCFRCTVVLATAVDPNLSRSRTSVHQRQATQFSFRNKSKSKSSASTSRSKPAASKFASKHLNRTSHASFFQRKEKTRQQQRQTSEATSSRTIPNVDAPDENGHPIVIPDEMDDDEYLPRHNGQDVTMLSPEIPLQSYGKHGIDADAAAEGPECKRIKDVFFSTQSQQDNTILVLAPDSGDED